jgi:hypothetical protein
MFSSHFVVKENPCTCSRSLASLQGTLEIVIKIFDSHFLFQSSPRSDLGEDLFPTCVRHQYMRRVLTISRVSTKYENLYGGKTEFRIAN